VLSVAVITYYSPAVQHLWVLTGQTVQKPLTKLENAFTASGTPGISYGMTYTEVRQHLPPGATIISETSGQLIIQEAGAPFQKFLDFQNGQLVMIELLHPQTQTTRAWVETVH
jgi:hypothetical protein